MNFLFATISKFVTDALEKFFPKLSALPNWMTHVIVATVTVVVMYGWKFIGSSGVGAMLQIPPVNFSLHDIVVSYLGAVGVNEVIAQFHGTASTDTPVAPPAAPAQPK